MYKKLLFSHQKWTRLKGKKSSSISLFKKKATSNPIEDATFIPRILSKDKPISPRSKP